LVISIKITCAISSAVPTGLPGRMMAQSLMIASRSGAYRFTTALLSKQYVINPRLA
jgi:hypothetical protein